MRDFSNPIFVSEIEMLHLRDFSHTLVIPRKMSPYSSLNKNDKMLDLLNMSFQFYLKTKNPLVFKTLPHYSFSILCQSIFSVCSYSNIILSSRQYTGHPHKNTTPIGSNGFLLVCQTSRCTLSNKNYVHALIICISVVRKQKVEVFHTEITYWVFLFLFF